MYQNDPVGSEFPLMADRDYPPTVIRTRKTAFTGLFIFMLIIVGYTFIHLGKIGWPGLHWDAALYGTPVLNVASGKGWVFGGYVPQIIQRNNLLYNFHGFLHVFLYGVVLKATTWGRYIFAQGIINSFTFSLYSCACLYVLNLTYGVRLYSVILSIFIGSVAGVICIGLQGRPEQIAPLILTIPLISIIFTSNSLCLALLLGFSSGLLLVVSPLIGLVFSAFALFYMFGTSESRWLIYLRYTSILIILIVLTSVSLISLITPFSPVEWYSQVGGVSGDALNFEGWLVAIRSQGVGMTLIAPAWNLTSIFLLIASGIWLWRSKKSWTSMLFLTIAIILFNEKMNDYSYTAFIPFGLVLCLRQANSSKQSILSSHWSINFGAMALSSSYMIVLVMYLIASAFIPFSELSPISAQLKFANSMAGRELASGSAAVGFPALSSPSMVVLGDAGTRFVSFNTSFSASSDQSLQQYESKTGNKVNWFVFPQTLTKIRSVPPSSIFVGPNRFALVNNGWVSPGFADMKLKPIKLTNRNNFAIYRRSS